MKNDHQPNPIEKHYLINSKFSHFLILVKRQQNAEMSSFVQILLVKPFLWSSFQVIYMISIYIRNKVNIHVVL
jgi:hypothetical protein